MKTSEITAIVLTKNEIANLDRCFASLRWCREIILVDSGSVDGTQQRAVELGARVLLNVQHGPFNIAMQRNWALEHAGIDSGWVLFLDADEVVPAPLKTTLESIAAFSANNYDAYELTPRYIFWGKWLKRTQGYPNWHPRFVRVGFATYQGGVWEHFSPGVKVGRIGEPYDHFANSKGFSDWLARHDRYSSWDAQKIVEFLESGDQRSLGTSRKARLRLWAARLWPLRPWARFFQMYIIRLGFVEGIPAFVFCLLYFFYEWMTVVKVVELKRLRKGLPL